MLKMSSVIREKKQKKLDWFVHGCSLVRILTGYCTNAQTGLCHKIFCCILALLTRATVSSLQVTSKMTDLSSILVLCMLKCSYECEKGEKSRSKICKVVRGPSED